MSDLSEPQAPATQTSRRERLREIIRAEVAKARPIDDARRPVELIVETSVRLADQDAGTVEVIDEQGRLRSGITIEDVLRELRAKHPTLFKADKAALDEVQAVPAADARPGITVSDAPAAPEPVAPEPPPRRDWLIIGEGPPAGSTLEASAPPAAAKVDWQERKDALARVTQDIGSRLGSAATSLTSRLHGAGDSMANS